ncbi:MAG: type I phosphomannose isomerase catalytic subunit [Erysipelotrichaceae bacterium]
MNNIFKLTPAFKDYLWGGVKLIEDFNKVCDLSIVAESWELSTHPDGTSVIATGKYKGIKLSDYIQNKEVLGTNCLKFDRFPMLVKFIDAKQALSIQVHPDNEYALKNEQEFGKTEVWYVLDAQEGAKLVYGVNREISKEELRNKINDGTVMDCLREVPVKKGDVFFIPSGTIHAIGAGIVVCEIQQNSNSTYRVYDFKRKGVDGKERPLHIDKALDVSKLTPSDGNFKPIGESCNYGTYQKVLMAKSENFVTDIYDVFTKCDILVDNSSFKTFTCTSGNGTVKTNDEVLNVKKGDTFFVDANFGNVEVCGELQLLVSYVE